MFFSKKKIIKEINAVIFKIIEICKMVLLAVIIHTKKGDTLFSMSSSKLSNSLLDKYTFEFKTKFHSKTSNQNN